MFVFVVAAGCSATPTAPTPVPVVPIDAAPPGITTIAGYDPASGMHLDDDGPRGSAHHVDVVKRPGRPIEVTLRSTPAGATAFVDGQPLGPTPAFWQGEANGRDHEFTFTLPHHASARYRFVPITSGVVHARLEPVASDDPAAQSKTAVPPVLPPTIVPPPPPPTIVSPDAAPIDAPAAGPVN